MMNNKVNNVPKLRFKEFSLFWSIVTIGNLLKIKSGFGFNASEYIVSQDRVPLLQIENVSYGKVVWGNNTKYLPSKYIDEYPDLSLKQGDIVIALNRPVTNNELKIAILSESDEPSILYQRVGKLVINSQSIDRYYIFYVFQKYVKEFVLSQSVGSDQPFISINALYKSSIPTPSLEEQQKIAEFLSSVDNKLQALKQKQQLLQQYKKGMMQKLFSQQIRFKDENGQDYPEWEYILAKKLFKNCSNKNHKSDLPILAVTQDQGVVKRSDIEKHIPSSKESIASYKVIDKGDFIISLRSFQGGIEYSRIAGICSPAYTVLKADKFICDDFYRYYFKKESFISQLSMTVVGIRDGKQISYDVFSGLKLPFPSIPEQQKIANFLSAIDQKIEGITKQIEQTALFKKGLLQQLFV